ncbi:hypothetical protein [Rhodovulum sp. 12E13]|uniref:hypothetical protein n=1 Tax=Rhodovulum sp. 12E13 TaxID=2203891 RepID=UPI0018F7B77A|nr:hypothetical protein [Rhodovulum sp. 12E13]
MRALALLPLVVALAACQFGAGGADEGPGGGTAAGDGPHAGYVLDDAPAAADETETAEPVPEPEPEAEREAEPIPEPIPEPEAEPDPTDARFAAARAACEKEGGRFGRAPGGGEARICFRTPRDANAPCRTGADCEGACLARSRTCAPILPLLGCHDVILSNGLRATECVQ